MQNKHVLLLHKRLTPSSPAPCFRLRRGNTTPIRQLGTSKREHPILACKKAPRLPKAPLICNRASSPAPNANKPKVLEAPPPRHRPRGGGGPQGGRLRPRLLQCPSAAYCSSPRLLPGGEWGGGAGWRGCGRRARRGADSMYLLGNCASSVPVRVAAIHCATAAGARAYLEGGLEWTLGKARGFRSAAAAMAPIKVTCWPAQAWPSPATATISPKPSAPLKAMVPSPKPCWLSSFLPWGLLPAACPPYLLGWCPRLSSLFFYIHLVAPCDGSLPFSDDLISWPPPPSGTFSFVPGSLFNFHT